MENHSELSQSDIKKLEYMKVIFHAKTGEAKKAALGSLLILVWEEAFDVGFAIGSKR